MYEDRNGNGEYDPGEEVSEAGTGFNGVPLVLTVENFERRVVADRNGQFRMPQFEPVGAGGAAETAEAEAAPRRRRRRAPRRSSERRARRPLAVMRRRRRGH